MLRLKHAVLLFVEFGRYAVTNRRLWPLVLVLLLVSLATIAVATQLATPFIYTLF